MTQGSLYRLTSEHLRAFREFSGDCNPLHCDSDYALRTEFGKVVCFGMSAVLLGIGIWAKGRQFKLISIKGDFKKPFFINKEFSLEIQESKKLGGQSVIIRYLDGKKLLCKIQFQWRAEELLHAEISGSPSFSPSDPASYFDLNNFKSSVLVSPIKYQPNWDALKKSLPLFHLSINQLPYSQLSAFLGASYLVGMKYPGAQALFSRFDFAFLAATDSHATVWSDIQLSFHSAFKMLEISAHGSEGQTFLIETFVRPLAVNYSLKQVREAVDESSRFKNQTVLITGGTRGFGAVLSKMFILHGATVIATYRSSTTEADAMAKELVGTKGKILFLKGDLSSQEDCTKMRTELKTKLGIEDALDLIICNASPLIGTFNTLDQPQSEFDAFVNHSVSIHTNTCSFFLPFLKNTGTLVTVSSIFVTQPKPNFEHYITAKNAIEKFARELEEKAKLDPLNRRKFLIIRPPMMLTDQTNSVSNLEKPVEATRVAAEFLSLIC